MMNIIMIHKITGETPYAPIHSIQLSDYRFYALHARFCLCCCPPPIGASDDDLKAPPPVRLKRKILLKKRHPHILSCRTPVVIREMKLNTCPLNVFSPPLNNKIRGGPFMHFFTLHPRSPLHVFMAFFCILLASTLSHAALAQNP